MQPVSYIKTDVYSSVRVLYHIYMGGKTEGEGGKGGGGGGE